MRSLRESPWRALAAALLVGAAAAGLIAALTWSDPLIEGAYINRSVNHATFSAIVSGSGEQGGREWLGLAIGLAVAGALVLAVSVYEKRRSGAAAPGP